MHVQRAIIKLDTQPKLSSTSATALEVDDGSIRWGLVLQHKHWRVTAFAFPGA